MHRILAYLEEAVTSLWRNRMRSLLTMLGMIIGSASIITVFGISRATTSGIASTFGSFGTFPVIVQADPAQDYPSIAQIHYADVRPVARALQGITPWVIPEWNRTYLTTFGNKHDYPSVVATSGFHDDGIAMQQGRKLSQEDVSTAAHVCVITADLGAEYFGTGNALGNYLRINGGRYRVVGVYSNIRGSFLNSLVGSSTVAIPYTTFHRDVDPSPPDYILIYAPSGTEETAGKLAIGALQRIHGPGAKYVTQNTADLIKSFENVLNIVGVGLAAIGGVALIVAGIGIMNIMLVSVTERTREIGIRKAVGASRNDIALQFLMESVVLALVGGGIGMVIGVLVTVGGASLLSQQLGEMIIPYVFIVSLAVGFSIVVGVLFGTYPALRAARLDPIEALRA
ncbi:MAG TPA: ABC transporter permease [Candidatus Dormibacteraeota bacterium]|nr:ABC transporter permease [Candidatus Dormibacteraeota bacterium]